MSKRSYLVCRSQYYARTKKSDQHINNGEDWSVYVKYPNGLDKDAMYVDFNYYTIV